MSAPIIILSSDGSRTSVSREFATKFPVLRDALEDGEMGEDEMDLDEPDPVIIPVPFCTEWLDDFLCFENIPVEERQDAMHTLVGDRAKTHSVMTVADYLGWQEVVLELVDLVVKHLKTFGPDSAKISEYLYLEDGKIPPEERALVEEETKWLKYIPRF